ncbi:MAG: hypothetical protein QM681_23610 [Novosphingobium sp.]
MLGVLSAQPVSAKDLQCDISLSIAREIVNEEGSNLIFSDWSGRSESHGLGHSSKYDWANAEGRRVSNVRLPTASEMQAVQQRSGYSAIKSCGEVRDFLTDHHVPFGEDALDQARTLSARHDIKIVTLSRAVVYSHGEFAIVQTGFSGVDLGGGGWISIYRRTEGGEWIKLYTAPTWIG